MTQVCTTTMKATAFSHSWAIPNFSSYDDGMKLCSMVFTGNSPDSEPVSWYYLLEIKGNSNQSICRQIVIAAFTDSYIPRSRLLAKIELNFNNVYYKYSCSDLLQPNAQIGKGITIDQETLTSYAAVNDNLTLRFNCKLYQEIVNGNPKQTGPGKQTPDTLLADHIGSLLTSNKFVDVKLIVGKRQFPAHKVILAARSPVFEAMFNHEMQESKQNTVKITDINPEVFQEVLRFIYTGTVQKMDKLASDLLIAADKYALENLKTKCGEYLGSKLSVETVTSTLALADKHNAGKLKQLAIQFISQHVKQLNPADWKEVLTNNFDVAAEIIAQMVKTK